MMTVTAKINSKTYKTVNRYASAGVMHLVLLRHWPLTFWSQNVMSCSFSPTAPKRD